MTRAYDPEDTELASGFKVRDYRKARNAEDGQSDIAEAIRRRFKERYIDPVSGPNCKHGFTIMAVSCLMVEAFESFRQGWESSEGNKGKAAFCFFFDSAQFFKDFRGHAQAFYKHVRCGILHQAETTGGWRIHRVGPLFDPATLTINAVIFLNSLTEALDGYCDDLKNKPWESEEWKYALKKMDAICKNCQPSKSQR